MFNNTVLKNEVLFSSYVRLLITAGLLIILTLQASMMGLFGSFPLHEDSPCVCVCRLLQF